MSSDFEYVPQGVRCYSVGDRLSVEYSSPVANRGRRPKRQLCARRNCGATLRGWPFPFGVAAGVPYSADLLTWAVKPDIERLQNGESSFQGSDCRSRSRSDIAARAPVPSPCAIFQSCPFARATTPSASRDVRQHHLVSEGLRHKNSNRLIGSDIFCRIIVVKFFGHLFAPLFCKTLRHFDVSCLSTFIATTQQNDNHVASTLEINPISRHFMDAQFTNTLAYRCYITKMAKKKDGRVERISISRTLGFLRPNRHFLKVFVCFNFMVLNFLNYILSI